MTLGELYEKAVSTGIGNDPRGIDIVNNELLSVKKEFDELKDKDKEFFDKETLKNPYADSRILYGNGDEEIKTILAGD